MKSMIEFKSHLKAVKVMAGVSIQAALLLLAASASSATIAATVQKEGLALSCVEASCCPTCPRPKEF